jgi:hypothetical protein
MILKKCCFESSRHVLGLALVLVPSLSQNPVLFTVCVEILEKVSSAEGPPKLPRLCLVQILPEGLQEEKTHPFLPQYLFCVLHNTPAHGVLAVGTPSICPPNFTVPPKSCITTIPPVGTMPKTVRGFMLPLAISD